MQPGKLNNTQIKNAVIKPKEYALADGNGLFLVVQPNRRKYWKWRYWPGGKEKKMSLGEWDIVTLAQAREKVYQNRKLLASGIDPIEVRKSEQTEIRNVLASEPAPVHPFREVAATWFKKEYGIGPENLGQKNHGHKKLVIAGERGDSNYHIDVWARLSTYALPVLGDTAIAAIDRPTVAQLVGGIAAGDVARRVRQQIDNIFEYAMNQGWAAHNPAAFKPGSVLTPRDSRNFAKAPDDRVPELLQKIHRYEGELVRYALRLLNLTLLRTGELLPAKRKEFDLAQAMWTLPEGRMKAVKFDKERPAKSFEHMVPLSTQAMAIVRVLMELTPDDPQGYLLPGEGSNLHMNKNSPNVALHAMGFKDIHTGHGFRGLGSTKLNEMGYPPRVVDRQLGHLIKKDVERVYNKALFIEPRIVMMQAWADFMDETRLTGKLPPHLHQEWMRLEDRHWKIIAMQMQD